MDIRSFDLILLFILAIVVSMIIGYNIIYIIDKKISSVTINIPPVNIPKPIVSVKINKIEGDNDKYLVNVTRAFQNSNNEKINPVNNAQEPVPITAVIKPADSQINSAPVGNQVVSKQYTNTTMTTGYGTDVEMDVVEPFGNFASANFKTK